MTFSVNALPETFEKSGRTSVVGVIHVNASGYIFPDNVWYDFPVVITSWWLREVSKLLTGTDKNCSCWFMDGPFQYDIETRPDGSWNVRFIRRGKDETSILIEGIFNPVLVVQSLLSTAAVVIQTCQEKGWISDDLNNLIEAYSVLSRMEIS